MLRSSTFALCFMTADFGRPPEIAPGHSMYISSYGLLELSLAHGRDHASRSVQVICTCVYIVFTSLIILCFPNIILYNACVYTF